MPNINVTGPDGSTFAFPDDTPAATITNVLQTHYAGASQRSGAAPAPNQAGMFDDLIPKAGQAPAAAPYWAGDPVSSSAPQQNMFDDLVPKRPMVTLNIQGRNVSVDHSFLTMPPDQQNAAVDEIAKSIGIGSPGSASTNSQGAQYLIPGAEGMPLLPSAASPNRTQDIGAVRAADDAVRALANGMTFGLADRAAAGMGALTGVGGVKSNYAGNLNYQQARTAAAPNPVLNMVGSAAVPIGAFGAAAKGATLGAKAILGAGTGGVLGAVQGAAESPDWTNLPQTAQNAGIGAGVGAIMGGAIPIAGAGLGATYNKAADIFTGGIPGMSRVGANHLISAVQADTPQAVRMALNQYGPQATLADAGPALLGKAQGASLNSDDARSVLQTALTQRNAGTNSRIMGDVNAALGPGEDPQTVTNNIRALRTSVDNQNYPKALDNAPPVDTTGLLAQLGTKIGSSVGMERKALSSIRDMLMTTVNDAPVPVTDATILHKVKGELDNVINYGQPELGIPAGALSRQQGALKQFRGALNDTLEEQVPGYAQANAASSALAKRAEAVESGTQLFDSGKTAPSPDRFSGDFSQMQPGEQIAFAKGTRGEIARLLGTKMNDLQALKGALQGEGGWNTAKLSAVYGPDAVDQLTSSVDRNMKFRDTYNKVVENSQTAQRNAAAGAMRPQPPGDMPLINPNMSITGLIGAGGKKAADLLLAAVRRDPAASYGDVARVLSAQGPQRDAAFQAIQNAIAQRGQNATAAPAAGGRVALIAAILANGQLRNRLRSQSQ